MTRRENITGIRVDQPTSISEFDRSSKDALIRDMTLVADAMTYLAQLILLQLNLPSTLKLQNVKNPNLLILAAQYYGDLRKWSVIGNNSGLSSPVLEGVGFDLSLPRIGNS